MRVGVISDVHGNVLALDAALAALRREGAQRVVCLGDLVGYGPYPNEVIERLREEAIPCTLGGTDARVAFAFAEPAGREGVAEETLAWTRDVLKPEHVAWLRNLPVQHRIDTPAGDVRMFHGAEDDPSGRTDLRMHPQVLQRLLDRLACRVLAVGGSHVPYERHVGYAIAFNPGSVGLSLNGEPGADYALVETSEGEDGTAGVALRMGKAEYDVGAAAFDVIAWGLPAVIADVLRHGRMVDTPAEGA